jgi:hypothetical protein
MSKNGTKFSLDCPFKVNQKNVQKFKFLSHNRRSLIQIRIRIWHPHLEGGFRMRIQETKIMRIHADADPQHCRLIENEKRKTLDKAKMAEFEFTPFLPTQEQQKRNRT